MYGCTPSVLSFAGAIPQFLTGLDRERYNIPWG